MCVCVWGGVCVLGGVYVWGLVCMCAGCMCVCGCMCVMQSLFEYTTPTHIFFLIVIWLLQIADKRREAKVK